MRCPMSDVERHRSRLRSVVAGGLSPVALSPVPVSVARLRKLPKARGFRMSNSLPISLLRFRYRSFFYAYHRYWSWHYW